MTANPEHESEQMTVSRYSSQTVEEHYGVTQCPSIAFKLTFRIFVVESDIFSVVTINTFGADVPPHTAVILLDL